MRRNIAKISALIMAATTTMSPMMPAATTVAWAAETDATSTDNYVFVAGSVVYDYDHIDWSNMTIPVSYTEKSDIEGSTLTREVTTTAAVGDFVNGVSYFPAECGGHDAQVVFTLLGRSGETLGSSEKTVIPEGYTGYEHKEHNIVEHKENIVNATHMEVGSYDLVESCTDCQYENTTHVTIPVQGHVFVEKIDKNSFDNIKVDENGDAILDENGLPQPADKKKNASYDVIEVCEEDGVVYSRKKVVIPVSEGVEQWVYTAVEGTRVPVGVEAGKNTHFHGNANAMFWYYMDNKEDYIWLNDCTKDGVYNLIHLNSVLDNGNPDNYFNLNNVLGVESVTIPAHHYWGLTEIDAQNSSTNLVKDENGEIVAITDEDGNAIGAYNTHCTEPATVVLYHECENCGVTEKVDTVIVPGTGNHQLGDFVPNEDDMNYTPVDKDYHSYNIHRQCTLCGEYFDDRTAEEEHHWTVKRENVVDATCGFSGSYDRVVYCEDCGYEFSRQLITVNPTCNHEFGDMYVEWTGNMYIGDQYDGQDYPPMITAVAKQTCTICNGKGENAEEFHGLATGCAQSGVAKLFDQFNSVYVNPEESSDYRAIGYDYYNEKLEIEVGEPTGTKYACAPSTVELSAYYTGYNANNEYLDHVLVGTKEVVYYANTAEYEARVQHVAGNVKTVVEEDGTTYKITYCAVCGEEIAREKIETEPEKTLGQVSGLKADTNGVDQTVISWDTLEGADGYIVIAINDKVRGQQIGYTATTSFVDVNAKSDDYNYYWVVPYFKNANGGIVKGQLTGYVYAMGLTDVALAAESTADGVKLTWDAVPGATSYRVKAKTATGAAKVLDTVIGTEYVDVDASADEFTFYWVFPCYTNAAGKTVVGTISSSNYVYGMTK